MIKCGSVHMLVLLATVGCAPHVLHRGGELRSRTIIASGQAIDAEVWVVHWEHPSGMSAYRGDRGGHFGQRGGRAAWSLDELRRHVDLVVIHYDAVGSSRRCFDVLQQRGLSCHFLLDTDGTIYQTLDLRERAWHATVANDRSIGIELAQRGAVEAGDGPVPGGEIVGVIQGRRLRQPPFTDAQYRALASLLAALHEAFPRIALDVPRLPDGTVVPHQLDPAAFASFSGVIGHYHVQANKIDPGPAFDWDRVLADARRHAAR